MSHAIKLSEAFQLANNGARTMRRKDQDSQNRHNQDDQSGHDMGKSKGKDGNIGNNGIGQKQPVLLYATYKARRHCHYLKDCAVCPDEETLSSNA